MADGCWYNLSKYLLFLVNLCIAVLAIALIVVMTLAYKDPPAELSDKSWPFQVPFIIGIVVGVIIFFIAFMGCCGAIQESSCMLTTYGVILVIMLVIKVALAIVIFVFPAKVDHFIDDTLKKELNNTQANQTSAFWDGLQRTYHCCGVDGPKDWKANIPKSCCENLKNCTTTDGPHYQIGCRKAIMNQLKPAMNATAITAIVYACVEIIGSMLAFNLASHLRGIRRAVY